MGQYTSYYLYQKYESRNGQDPVPCSPNIYSIDGYGTMEKVIKMENDPDCGYTPPPVEPIYRWYQIPITEDYICANCPSGTTIERWVNSGTTCSEGDLYNLQVKQISFDGGSTWENTSDTQLGELIETSSSECNKAILTLSDSSNTYVECNNSTSLIFDELRSYNPIYAVVGECVTTIGQEAFYGKSLTAITLASSVTTIGDAAFMNCKNLETITLDYVVTIGSYAFHSCSGLTSVEIGSGVTSIGDSAFAYCSGLTSITINATTPPTLRLVSAYPNTFDNTNNCPIYVPYGSIGVYKAAWTNYASRIYGIGYLERWVNLDPSVDYYCVGNIKYYKQKKQWSIDGSTWFDTDPPEYQMGSEIGSSSDCQVGKSLDEIISESTTAYTQGIITITPNIDSIEKIYLDQTQKGSYNSNCTLNVYSGSSSNRFTINSYSGTQQFLVTIGSTETTYYLDSIASDSSYTWVYYNPSNSNEIIIDVHELFGEYGVIKTWLYRFATGYVTHITQVT